MSPEIYRFLFGLVLKCMGDSHIQWPYYFLVFEIYEFVEQSGMMSCNSACFRSVCARALFVSYHIFVWLSHQIESNLLPRDRCDWSFQKFTENNRCARVGAALSTHFFVGRRRHYTKMASVGVALTPPKGCHDWTFSTKILHKWIF